MEQGFGLQIGFHERPQQARQRDIDTTLAQMIGTPQQFASVVAHEAPRWAEIVKTSGIKVD